MAAASRALMYPYDISLLHMIMHKFPDFEIIEVASPNGWGYVGKDAGSKIGIEGPAVRGLASCPRAAAGATSGCRLRATARPRLCGGGRCRRGIRAVGCVPDRGSDS